MAVGHKTGGRQKGVPNKATLTDREAFRAVYENRLQDLDRWIKETGDGYEVEKITREGVREKVLVRDPAKAAELLLRMAEHFVPRVAPSDVTDEKDGSIQVVIHKLAVENP